MNTNIRIDELLIWGVTSEIEEVIYEGHEALPK